MTTILHVRSSSAGRQSVTRAIGEAAVARLAALAPDAQVIERDLVADAVPHVHPGFVEALSATQGDDPRLALSDRLVGELLGADAVVIEAPMYNFGIPSALKAWIDHVVRARRTFRYGESGPVGLAGGKQAVLVLGRGGVYSEGAAKALDHQESYLRTILGFIGITDVQVIAIEGVGMGQQRRSEALTRAERQASALTWHAA